MSISLNQLPQNNKPKATGGEQKEVSELRKLLSKEISLGRKTYSEKKKEHFFSEMAMLIDAGVDIRTALEILKQEQTKEKDSKLINSLYNDLISGSSLSEAMERSKNFGVYEVYSVRIGEETGKLVNVLQQMADYYKSRVAFKRKLVNSLSYPVVVLFTAVLVVMFMLNFVVPMFSDIFRQSNAELPGITQWVMAVSAFFKKYFPLFALCLLALIATYFYVRKKELFRKKTSHFFLRIKYFGDIIKLNYLYRFCKTMSLLIGSGLPLLRSVQLIQKMITYYPMEQDLLKIEQDLFHGKSLYESMDGSVMFDKKMISLTRLGEEVNRQEMVYERLSYQYEQELQQKMEMLSSVLEPVIILIIGFFVAIILISMYLPMFKMGGAIG